MNRKTPAGVLLVKYCCYLIHNYSVLVFYLSERNPLACVSIPGDDPNDIGLDGALTHIQLKRRCC